MLPSNPAIAPSTVFFGLIFGAQRMPAKRSAAVVCRRISRPDNCQQQQDQLARKQYKETKSETTVETAHQVQSHSAPRAASRGPREDGNGKQSKSKAPELVSTQSAPPMKDGDQPLPRRSTNHFPGRPIPRAAPSSRNSSAARARNEPHREREKPSREQKM